MFLFSLKAMGSAYCDQLPNKNEFKLNCSCNENRKSKFKFFVFDMNRSTANRQATKFDKPYIR